MRSENGAKLPALIGDVLIRLASSRSSVEALRLRMRAAAGCFFFLVIDDELSQEDVRRLFGGHAVVVDIELLLLFRPPAKETVEMLESRRFSVGLVVVAPPKENRLATLWEMVCSWVVPLRSSTSSKRGRKGRAPNADDLRRAEDSEEESAVRRLLVDAFGGLPAEKCVVAES